MRVGGKCVNHHNLYWNTQMQARMTYPLIVVPEVMPALIDLAKHLKQGGVPPTTLHLVSPRVSQINRSNASAEMLAREARTAGEAEGRLSAVAAWRGAPCFSDAERAALALSESVTRLSDRADPVPDEIWREAARHYEERDLATLILSISMVDFGNRINGTTKQLVGACNCPEPSLK